MGKRNKKQNNKKGKGQNNSESDNQNVEGKCCHVQECVKFSNLNNTIPHADLSKCQDCLKLIEKPTEASCDKKSDSAEDGNDGPDSTQGEEKPGICVCLRCGNIACSRQSSHQHAIQHYNSKPSHSLVVNLSNWLIWCYKCDNEVDVEINPALGQCLTILKKALGVKNTKQEKRIETSQKKSASNIYSLTGNDNAVKGLANLGNTCFFNSVMQNLCQSQLLRVAVKHLMTSDFQFCILPSEDKQELGPLSVTIVDKPGPLTRALAKFLQDMKTEGKKHVINPGYLFTEICEKAPRFKGFRQQDSQELLRYLLDSIRTEEIKGVKRALLRSFGVKNADKVDEDVHEKLRVYGRNARAPVIDTLFGGQLVSSVECRECHKVSTIMESFFDLSLSLAINNQAVLKQANTMSATKKKQLPAQVTNKKNSTEKVDKETEEKPKKELQAPVTDKKNSSKKADKTTKEKPKPPPSKYQLKKMKKETKKSKKKNRKRLNSTSSTGKKQSEVDEDDQTDEDENNENPNRDVIETSVDDVTETLVDDVTGTSVDDVTGNSVDDVTGTSVDDVTGTSVDDVTGTSVEEDVTNVKENKLMVDDRVKSEPVLESSDSDFDINKIRDCDVSATSQHDVIDTSPDGVTATSGDDENGTHDSRILNSEEESSSIHLDQMHNSEENKDFTESSNEDNTMKNEKNMDVLSQEPLVNGGDLLESSQSSENINGISENEDFGTPVQNNEISSENQIRHSDVKICFGGALDGHDCKTESLLQSNGEDVLNSSDKQQQDCQNNEISSENILGGCESGINGKTGCTDASDGKDCKNESVLHSNTADVSNSTDEGQTLCYTSPISHNLSNDSDNDVVLAENKTGVPVDNKAEYISPNCETSDMNDICVNSIQIKSTGPSQDGDAGGINSKESNQIPVSEIADSETGQALENKLSNLSLESNKGNSNRSPESPAFVTKFEDDDADKLTQDKLCNLSTDKNRDSSNGSHEDPVSFNKTIDSETHETTGSEHDDFTGNTSTVLPQNGDSKNSKENKNVLDYVNQIVDDILESCFHNISTSLSEEAKLKVETDISFECKKIKEEYNSPANFSLKENDFGEAMCKDEFRSSVNESAVSLSSSQTDKEKNQEYAKKIAENAHEEFLHSDSNSLLSRDAQTHSEIRSFVTNTPTKTDHEKIQEYVKKIVDGALRQCLHIDVTTRKQDSLSKFENISKDETSDSRNIGNDSENLELVPGTENVSAVSRSEILRGNHSLGSMEAIKSNVMSVESCLKRFCSPEILDGDNMFICEQCNQNNTEEEEEETNDEDEKEDSDDDKDTASENKTKRKPIYTEAVKQLLINQAPPIFTLHLKRFHQVGYSLKKIPKHVDFPLLLDIAPFCHKSSKLATDSEGKVLYSLFGIVEHSGSLHSGHYTAYCRVPTVPSSLFETKFENLTQLLKVMDQMWTHGGKRESYVHEGLSSSRWFYISDSHVSEVGLERVLKAQAYLLFYERMVLSRSGEIENTEPKTVTG